MCASLVQSFNRTSPHASGMLNEKCYLTREFLENFQLKHAVALLTTIDKRISSCNKFNLFIGAFNVALSACLIIELLELMSAAFDQLQVRCQSIRKKVEDLGHKFLDEVSGEQEMRFLLLEKDLLGRDALELIATHDISIFLRSAHADEVVKEIWRSAYGAHDSIWMASTNSYLLFNFYHCMEDEEQKRRLFFEKDIRAIENHSLQFVVWRFSGKSRVVVEVLLSLYFMYEAYQTAKGAVALEEPVMAAIANITAIESELSVMNPSAPGGDYDYDQLRLELTDYIDENQPRFEEFYNSMMFLCFLSVIFLFYGFQILADIAYTSVTGKFFSPWRVKTQIDIVLFFVFLVNIFVTLSRNLRGANLDEGPNVVDWSDKALIYCRNFRESWAEERYLITVGIFILWFRLCNFFRFNEHLGRFISIVRNILPQLFYFFLLYLVNVTIFSMIASVSFYELPGYVSFMGTFRTNFFASFGSFDFNELGKSRIGYYYGAGYLIFFVVCNIGLFSSLFIAVVTTVFQEFEPDSNIYYMIETLKVRSITQADKNYSVLISLPAPLNFLLLFIAPALLTSKEPAKVNEWALKIAYIPILATSSLIFLAVEIVMWPFVYVKMFFHKLTMVWVYSKSYRISRADKFVNFLTYFLIGPFVIVGTTFADFFHFWRHALMTDLKKTKHKMRSRQMKKENL
jgi:hypothetical protein